MIASIEKMIVDMECPIIDALYLPDGTMYIFDSSELIQGVLSRSPNKDTLDNYLLSSDPECISRYDIFSVSEIGDFTINLGEGSWGSEGIAYLKSRKNLDLVWFLYMEYSNPFCKAELLANNDILIESTNGIKLHIPALAPELITVG